MACTKNSALHCPEIIYGNAVGVFYCDIFLLYCVYKVRACYPFRCEHAVLRAEVLAERAHMSVGRFQHIFKEVAGVSPAEYTEKMRIARAKELLTGGSCDISEIAFKCGFSEHSYFSKRFKKYTGVTPRQTRIIRTRFLSVDFSHCRVKILVNPLGLTAFCASLRKKSAPQKICDPKRA